MQNGSGEEEDWERGPKVGSRDHPNTIKLRMKAVGLATLSSLLVVFGVVKVRGGYTFMDAVSIILSGASVLGSRFRKL